MYSAKILGNSGNEITNHSAAKAKMTASVKAKKSFSHKSDKK